MDMNQCRKYTKPEIKLTNLYSCIQYLAHILKTGKGRGSWRGRSQRIFTLSLQHCISLCSKMERQSSKHQTINPPLIPLLSYKIKNTSKTQEQVSTLPFFTAWIYSS